MLRRESESEWDWTPLLYGSGLARDDHSVGTQPEEEQIDQARVVLVIRPHRADSVSRGEGGERRY